MATVMIDTLRVSRRLRDAGASEPLSDALAATLAEQATTGRDDLATKADLAVTDAKIDTLEGRVDKRFLSLENRILESENRILAAQNRMLVWTAGFALAAVGLTVTLIKAL